MSKQNPVHKLWLLTVGLLWATSALAHSPGRPPDDTLHTPKKGSAERQAILSALRHGQRVVFMVYFLKVHRGWAWADVTPLDRQGRPVAEGGPELLHQQAGTWKALDLSRVPQDPKDPLGAEDASRGFTRNVRRTFPGVPADIFPAPTH